MNPLGRPESRVDIPVVLDRGHHVRPFDHLLPPSLVLVPVVLATGNIHTGGFGMGLPRQS